MAHPLNVYTGRYGDKAIAGSGLVPIGITRYPPRFALPHALKANIMLLAPSAALLARARRGKVTPKQFEAEYIDQLEKVGVEAILRILRAAQGRSRGVILLCYEPAGSPCHRRQLASWIETKGGIMVPEFEFNMVAARAVAIGYVRRSRESTEKTVSLLAQKGAITDYAKAQGWTLAAIVEHDGVSGGRRSRFAALDAAIKTHGAGKVVCYHLDRLARDAAALLDWCASADKRGVAVHVVGRGRTEVSSAAGYLGTGVEAIVATHFRLLIGEKTRDALAHLRTQGKRWSRTAPFGFRWSADGRVEPDAGEQSAITRARTLRAAGLTLWAISARLASEGTLSRGGAPLTAKVIRAVLRRPS